MIKNFAELLKLSWPVFLISIPFGLLHCFLICYFRESLDAADNLQIYFADAWGGADVLLVINSGLLGWASIGLLERKLGLNGFILFPFALLIWILAIGGGSAASIFMMEHTPNAFPYFVTMCFASSIVTGVFVIYYTR